MFDYKKIIKEIFTKSEVKYSNIYSSGKNSICENRMDNNIIIGIKVNTLDFDTFELYVGNDVVLSIIYPHHFINIGENSYISHFFHEPLPFTSIIYANLMIKSSISYSIIYANITIPNLKLLHSSEISINGLDYYNLVVRGGICGYDEDFTYPNNIKYILSNYIYVQKLGCLIKNITKKN